MSSTVPGAAHRRVALELRAQRLVREHDLRAEACDPAHRDGVDAHLRRELRGQLARHQVERRLRGAVGDEAGLHHVARARGDVHDGAAARGLDHLRHGRAA